MTRSARILAGAALPASLLLAALGACASPTSTPSASRRGGGGDDAVPADPTSAFTAEDVQGYLRQLAPYFPARELEPAELARIEQEKYDAIVPIVSAWTKEQAFPEAARRLISTKLSVSGTRDGIDFELPGNLAAYVVREDEPFSMILKADHCVDGEGKKRDCDTGAPFQAGVLGTRAFLASRASRFNLTRASTMLATFACTHYPLRPELEPRLPRERLIELFKADLAPDSGAEAFGNGTACYSCHAQFGAHAQLFVRFDEKGTYRAEASGVQDPGGELGRAKDGLFASHLDEPEEARDEKSQMFGKPVNNLKEAAAVLAESDSFVPCQIDNLVRYALRIPAKTTLPPEVTAEIVERAGADPTFSALVIHTFAHPRVVASVVTGSKGTP